MPMIENKALDLGGLAHLVQTYIKNVKTQDAGTNLGDALYLTSTYPDNPEKFTNLGFSVDYTIGGLPCLSFIPAPDSPGMTWLFVPDDNNNIIASRKYVNAKTWDASDITSGTLPVSRGGTGGTSFTANRVLVSGTTTTSAVKASTITTTELGYLDGVTTNVQTQLNGKASASHSHDATSGPSGVYNIVGTNAAENSSTLVNPVYFSVRDRNDSFYIMAGRTRVASGSSARTVTVTLPTSMKHIYAPVICESIGGGASGTQYYNAVRASGGSGQGPGGDFVTTFQIHVGINEACYVNWMVLGDTR